jgi:hypothetical protein
MRLPLIVPAELMADQRPLYENMREGIEKNFKGFKTIAENGALMGPWNPWIHEPKFGKPIWDLTLALSVSPSLPGPAREVAILVTGAKFRSSYELYAMSSGRNGVASPTTSSPPSSPASDQRPHAQGGDRVRRRVRPRRPRHAAGA